MSFLSYDDEVTDFTNVPLKEFKIKLVYRCNSVREFIEKWHYSHNINGVISKYCFVITYNDSIVGAMIYGDIAMPGVYKKYCDSIDDVIELRRLCCIDKTPKNIESYFIGYTLRWLRKNTKLRIVISYSDLEYNHTGVIYKASNFKLVGQTDICNVIVYNNRQYHSRSLRCKYKGKLKPFSQKILNSLLKKEAYYKLTKPKNIWIYNMK